MRNIHMFLRPLTMFTEVCSAEECFVPLFVAMEMVPLIDRWDRSVVCVCCGTYRSCLAVGDGPRRHHHIHVLTGGLRILASFHGS